MQTSDAVENPINRILVANRGEIAVRVMQSCKELGIKTVAVYSTADRNMPHVLMADDAVEIGPPEANSSYLNIDRIIDACHQTGADAVHPGYGFLSENAQFAQRLAEKGITFIGPRPETMHQMGDKIRARQLMEANGVPVVPGFAPGAEQTSMDTFRTEANRIGYPVMIKASAGGGGRGMRVVTSEKELADAIDSARREAANAFGDDTIFMEKFVQAPRHIEIQVFGDRHGNIVHLFERECSIQRRHQKIIEESPSPALDDATRTVMADAAVKAARAVNYEGAGTVEFIYSDVDQSFFFLEMNTRLQVEHPVTELVTNRDLVAEQIRVARGERLSFAQHDLKQTGHAIEVRLYAEDPMRNFLPATGKIHKFAPSTRPGVRVDAGITDGSEISIYYDPMIAKIIVHHPGDRSAAIDLMRQALHDTVLFGPANNLDFLRDVLAHKEFRAGRFTTHFIAEHFPTYRGAQVTPDLREIARLSAGLVFFHGGSRLHEEDRRKQERQAVAAGGGDLAPWFNLEGFELWSD